MRHNEFRSVPRGLVQKRQHSFKGLKLLVVSNLHHLSALRSYILMQVTLYEHGYAVHFSVLCYDYNVSEGGGGGGVVIYQMCREHQNVWKHCRICSRAIWILCCHRHLVVKVVFAGQWWFC